MGHFAFYWVWSCTRILNFVSKIVLLNILCFENFDLFCLLGDILYCSNRWKLFLVLGTKLTKVRLSRKFLFALLHKKIIFFMVWKNVAYNSTTQLIHVHKYRPENLTITNYFWQNNHYFSLLSFFNFFFLFLFWGWSWWHCTAFRKSIWIKKKC